MIYIGIALIIFAGDILIKNYFEKKYDDKESKEVLGGRIILRKLHNKGAAFNLLHKWPDVTRYISGALTIGITFYFLCSVVKKTSVILKLGLSFMVGGSLSNFYDRMKRGYVVDYFSFQCRFQRLKKIVFNISDLFIFAGSILTAVTDAKKKKLII